MSITTSKYHPESKPSVSRPLAPSVTAKATGGSPAVPAPSRRELWGANLSTLDCCYGEVPAVESLSQKSKIFASSLSQGSLFALGIVLLCDTGLFHAFNRQRGKEAPQKPKSITGAGTKTPHPSQSEGSIPVAPPLSRLLCILSCRSKKVWPRWQALAESRL